MAVELEDVDSLIDVDLMRATPDVLVRRMTHVVNAFTDANRRWKDNRHKIRGLKKSDTAWTDLNGERGDLDTDLDTLKLKFKLVEHALYVRTAEMKMENKGII